MNANPKPASKRSRGLILTEEALKLLDQELRKRWEKSEARRASRTGKLTRDDKGLLLGIEAKTADKIYRRIGVDEITLRHVFEKLNILPRFSKEQYCVSDAPPSGNLPHVSTPCIGREAEVMKVKALLESNNLVTLTGTGGVGKTRLAIQVAEEMKTHYTAGIWFVELAGLAEVADQTVVPQKVATTLGIQEEKDRPLIQMLSDFLRGKPLLLILDNCEHLLETCADLADHLLSSCYCLNVLATSRERLNIASERPFYVPSLAVPDIKGLSGKEDIAKLLRDYASMHLFVERAGVLRPGFTATKQNAPLVASICHRLDGIPLAIELAAARMRSMTLDELESGLNDCFRILTGGSRVALPRQQTLWATMNWSYDLLKEKEKALLRRLAVFSDGYRREAAEQVCAEDGIEGAEVLDLLTSLVDKNLVVYQEQEGKARYHLLETVRQYGQRQLAESGERESVQGRHRNHFLALAEEVEPKLMGAQQTEWLQRLEAEHENLRAALNWSLSESGSGADLRLCGALGRFWWMRGHLSEGREWCARALGAAGSQEQTSARAKVLNRAGMLAYYQGDYAAARPYLQEGLVISRELGDRSGVASSLYVLGLVVSNQGDYASARASYEESLTISRELEDRSGIANSLNGLGSVAHSEGDYAAARASYEESLTICRELGSRDSIANLLKNLGAVAHAQGDHGTARACYEESLAISRELGDRSGVAHTLNGLGDLAHTLGDDRAARLCYEEGLTICRELGDRSGVAHSLGNLGGVSESQGDYRAARACYEVSLSSFREIGIRSCIATSLEAFASLAARESKTERSAVLWGAAEALREEIGSPLSPGEREVYDSAVAKARQALGEEAFLAAWAQGRSMTLEQAIEYALEAPV